MLVSGRVIAFLQPQSRNPDVFGKKMLFSIKRFFQLPLDQRRLLSKASFLLFSPHLGFFETDPQRELCFRFLIFLFKDSLVVDLIFPASHWTFVGVTAFSLGFPSRSHAAGD